MNPAELEKLIQRYFDGETSLDEERTLRMQLADPAHHSDSADEARAVMGVFAAQRSATRRKRGTHRQVWRAAAGFALLLAAAGTFLAFPRHNSAEYLSYCAGTEISDRADVIAFMQADLSAMADAAESVGESVDNDFEAISIALSSTHQ